MSLLPGQILPQSQTFGRTDKNGNVTIDRTWYLFLYNLALNALPSQSGGATGQPPQTVTVGPSPFVYQVPSAGVLVVSGPTMSAASATPTKITIVRSGKPFDTGLLAGLIPVMFGDDVEIAYSEAPTVVFLPS